MRPDRDTYVKISLANVLQREFISHHGYQSRSDEQFILYHVVQVSVLK